MNRRSGVSTKVLQDYFGAAWAVTFRDSGFSAAPYPHAVIAPVFARLFFSTAAPGLRPQIFFVPEHDAIDSLPPTPSVYAAIESTVFAIAEIA